jgi:putative ubiquitin-RnfH superfamily antitoxin RatB of RatAB toxin-antitoxin module
MGRVDHTELAIEVAWSPQAGEVRVVPLRLPAGSTVRDALRQGGVLEAGSGMDLTHCRIGVWGHLRELTDVLHDRDRVEVWRALRVDPKEARRQRSRQEPRSR